MEAAAFPAPPFPRTECACAECVRCCTVQPAHLIQGDIFRITDALVSQGRVTDVTGTLSFLRASRGAVVADSATGRRYRIGTITPRMEGGRCVFLTPDDRCSIHSVAPFGCAYFDLHMSTTEGDARSLWGLQQISRTQAYAEMRQFLEEQNAITAQEEEP